MFPEEFHTASEMDDVLAVDVVCADVKEEGKPSLKTMEHSKVDVGEPIRINEFWMLVR